MPFNETYPKKTAIADEAGFTLIEALMAIAIVGLLMMSLNLLLAQTMFYHQYSQDMAIAEYLAQTRMEQVKNVRYQDGNRDAFFDPDSPCIDMNEVYDPNNSTSSQPGVFSSATFTDEDFDNLDINNGTRFNFRTDCGNDIYVRQTERVIQATDYNTDHDRWMNRERFKKFRREVYVIDTHDYDGRVVDVTLPIQQPPPGASGPNANYMNPAGRDFVTVVSESATAENPATDFVLWVVVRVKWFQGPTLRQVTLKSQKAFHIPAT